MRAVSKRSTKKVAVPEKRIYVLVPKTVQVMVKPSRRSPAERVSFDMESGRLMAQNLHIGRLMEYARMMVEHDAYVYCNGRHLMPKYEEITGIDLAMRNSGELVFYRNLLLARLGKDGVFEFSDQNPDFNGTNDRVLTSVCTCPVLKSEVEDLLGHLPLYREQPLT